MPVTCIYRYVCCQMNVSFLMFHKSLSENPYRSVLCKITIDLLHFWDSYDVSLWEISVCYF